MRSGDLLLYPGSGIAGWVVRKWTASPYAHVGIAWIVDGQAFVLESYPGIGVRIMCVEDRIPVGYIPTGAVWSEEVERVAFSVLGEPYGWLDAIKAGLGMPTNERGYQCAEYAIQVLRAAQVSIPDIHATPGELVGLLAERAEIVKV